jgi:LPS export ABC transporter protein LptC
MRRIFLILLPLVFLTGCEEKTKPAVTALPSADIPSQESWNSTVVFSDSARIRAKLWSAHISAYDAERMTVLEESLRVDFYNDQAVHTSLLTARRGKVNDQTHDLEAYEHVVVVSDSGTTLRTERLFWNNQTRKIHTDAFVDIQSPREHIMGHGMESDQGLKNYRISKVSGQALTTE